MVDGRLDEAAWQEAARFKPAMHVPDFGGEPTERTEFLLFHDGEFLYLGCRAWDSEPEGIQAPSLQRNDAGLFQDWCTLNVDGLLDGETSLVFATTPAGIRTDGIIADDGIQGFNWDWDTYWSAAARETDEGWFAEIRVPFSSLAFQVREGRVVMGLSMWRNIARKNESMSWPPIPPNWGLVSPFKASQMQPVVLEGVEASRVVRITPYLLGGAGHRSTLPEGATEFDRASERLVETGLDLGYSVGPSFNLDLTVNTDFAQVEADDQQVNLDRFSLFFPEKRRFFQERGQVFEFPLGTQERLFHSRRVGLAEGRPVRILGGGRLVGRVGDWDLGALNLHTAESEALPSENHGVIRARRRVLNENSYLGGIVTSRVGSAGRYNVVYGLDATLRVLDQDYLTVNWAQSFDHDEAAREGAETVGPLDRGLFRIEWERRGLYGPMYGVEVVRSGPAFEPAMGFLRRRDYTEGGLRLGYGWDPGPGASILRYGAGVSASGVRRGIDGTLETGTVQPSATFATRGGRTVVGALSHEREDLAEAFDLTDDAGVPAGRHDFTWGWLSYDPPQGNLLRVPIRLEAGGFFDGTRRSIQVDPTWTASRHFRISGSYRLDRVEFSSRDQGFTAHVARIRGQVMLSPEISSAAFVQYNSELDRVTANVRFRYNPREGDDLYVVWNEGLNTALGEYDPVRPRTQARTVLVKYSRTFSLGF